MSDAGPSGVPRWLAYARLVRLPNVFSAAADILMGFWLTQTPALSPTLLLLIGASCSLYLAGMVWNDVFDLDTDRLERPNRPLPAGQITLRSAKALGTLLILAGVGLSAIAGLGAIVIALLLVVAIFLYDSFLKRTPIGPLGMGLCRGLNVLLGMSPVILLPETDPLLLGFALGNGLYITGVTWIARDEAIRSGRVALGAGALVMTLGLALNTALAVQAYAPFPTHALPLAALLVLSLAWAISRAIRDPAPQPVQRAVKAGLMGLTVLDASLVSGFRGLMYGIALLSLLLPALFLGRRIYST